MSHGATAIAGARLPLIHRDGRVSCRRYCAATGLPRCGASDCPPRTRRRHCWRSCWDWCRNLCSRGFRPPPARYRLDDHYWRRGASQRSEEKRTMSSGRRVSGASDMDASVSTAVALGLGAMTAARSMEPLNATEFDETRWMCSATTSLELGNSLQARDGWMLAADGESATKGEYIVTRGLGEDVFWGKRRPGEVESEYFVRAHSKAGEFGPSARARSTRPQPA